MVLNNRYLAGPTPVPAIVPTAPAPLPPTAPINDSTAAGVGGSVTYTSNSITLDAVVRSAAVSLPCVPCFAKRSSPKECGGTSAQGLTDAAAMSSNLLLNLDSEG